jgi:hypothetical protein
MSVELQRRVKMSVDFLPLQLLKMKDLFDGRLEKHEVHELKTKETNAKKRCLTDGQNYVWACSNKKVFVADFETLGVPDRIFQAITDEFGVEIVTDDDPRRMRNREVTEEEQAEARKRQQQQERRKKRAFGQLIRYLTGESYNISLVEYGVEKAMIAKRLIAKNPELLDEDKRVTLREAIESEFDAIPF